MSDNTIAIIACLGFYLYGCSYKRRWNLLLRLLLLLWILLSGLLLLVWLLVDARLNAKCARFI